jgi:hypothetical protein
MKIMMCLINGDHGSFICFISWIFNGIKKAGIGHLLGITKNGYKKDPAK